MMMMVQNCRGNNRTAPLFCFAGAGESLECRDIFFILVVRRFWDAKRIWAKPLVLLFQVVFLKRLFRKAATSVPSGDILKLFLLWLFSSELFFSLFLLVANYRLGGGFLILIEHTSLYTYFFLKSHKRASHIMQVRVKNVCALFLDVIVHLSSRVGGVIFLISWSAKI